MESIIVSFNSEERQLTFFSYSKGTEFNIDNITVDSKGLFVKVLNNADINNLTAMLVNKI